MKRTNYLKGLRIILAILFFVPILLYFIDFANILPEQMHYLLHIQLMPAILGGAIGIIIIQLLLALILGRIYCSTFCPAGVFQDVINRIFCIGKKKKKGSRRFNYHKPYNWLRYSILGVTTVFTLLGVSELCLLLDPYSNFGRIATNLFRPVVMGCNNLLSDLLMKMDSYAVYHVTISTVTAAGISAGAIALIVFSVMVIFRGRLFCNTICPIGTLLSLFSRYSLFRISFDKDTCTNCGNCEHTCKAEAINSKNMTVDTSRCVNCFNCTSSCPKDGLKYRFISRKNEETKKAVITAPVCDSNISVAEAKEFNSRRNFLTTSAMLAASVSVVSAFASRTVNGKKQVSHNEEKWDPLTPPGSISLDRFKNKCTGCQICVVHCPTQVLRPTGLEYGLDYMLKPRMAYINSYCNYSCTICSDVCPVEAIKPLSKNEKETIQIGVATFFIDRCVVSTKNQDCGACSEHCPTQAVHMVPYKGTLTIPQVNPDLCIGCGGCESICPVRPMRAILIKPNKVHKKVCKPKAQQQKKVEIDDFGF